MSELPQSPSPKSINLPASEEGFLIEQTSTRGDGSVKLGEKFKRDDIEFSRVVEHLVVHTEGEVAGSQFDGAVFASPQAVIDMLITALPDGLQYDQYDRAELTLTTEGVIVGYSGVKSVSELEDIDGVQIIRDMRIAGGDPAEVEGIKGAWFPEMIRNTETGRFEVATNPDGTAKNPHGKFEPEALLARVEEDSLLQALATDKITVILQKNPENEVPTVLTIFPGDNAPAFPSKIESEVFQADSLRGGPEEVYWGEHAFIQVAK